MLPLTSLRHRICTQITDCPFRGRSLASSKPYVQFNKNAALDKVIEQNAFLPKYEAKLGIDCDKCGKFQKWLTQEEYTMLGLVRLRKKRWTVMDLLQK